MAAAHTLLSQSRWSGVGVTDLIRCQLAPYTTDKISRFAARTSCLPCTDPSDRHGHSRTGDNAAQHGALSHPNGKVSVNRDRTGADTTTILTITWRELGGPPIAASVQSGYGLGLIRDLIPHELGGTVDLKLQSEDPCCKIEIPLTQK